MTPLSVLGWGCHHPHGRTGQYDESARRASHSELAVARLLVAEGHDVKTVAEVRGVRTPDLVACGVPVEVKAFATLDQREGSAPRARHLANKLLDARTQGAVAVVWGLGSGLSEATARAGFSLFCEKAASTGLGLSQLRSVRVVGDGFDISFSPVLGLRSPVTVAARVQVGKTPSTLKALQSGPTGRHLRPSTMGASATSVPEPAKPTVMGSGGQSSRRVPRLPI
ncbi:MAG: hypothetical protein ACP5VR_01265 [Acidimicrobiales bacterium]